ncbi:MAG: hypothetical protein NE330_15120 [Lentisphaeraceae bacterium]|nr:hypothetical protein [Lentisphaeraceae bacterium]
MSKPRHNRIKLEVSNETTGEMQLAIDTPTYFPLDTNALYKALMKELVKQEKAAQK